MGMKIETRWGEATLFVSKIKYYHCHVDVWKHEYNIIITYNTASKTPDQVTAIYNSFEDMVRTCKQLHSELISNFDMSEL